MGARKAMGVEIDPQSVLTAKRNLRLNGLGGKIEIREGSWGAVHEDYDLILANLVMAALLKLGKEIPGHLKRQGVAVVSGFGEKQLETVKDWFRSLGVIVSRHATLEGWSALVLEKGAQ
jgi:ribosomal protein L11 methyltransferase